MIYIRFADNGTGLADKSRTLALSANLRYVLGVSEPAAALALALGRAAAVPACIISPDAPAAPAAPPHPPRGPVPPPRARPRAPCRRPRQATWAPARCRNKLLLYILVFSRPSMRRSSRAGSQHASGDALGAPRGPRVRCWRPRVQGIGHSVRYAVSHCPRSWCNQSINQLVVGFCPWSDQSVAATSDALIGA